MNDSIVCEINKITLQRYNIWDDVIVLISYLLKFLLQKSYKINVIITNKSKNPPIAVFRHAIDGSLI